LARGTSSHNNNTGGEWQGTPLEGRKWPQAPTISGEKKKGMRREKKIGRGGKEETFKDSSYARRKPSDRLNEENPGPGK